MEPILVDKNQVTLDQVRGLLVKTKRSARKKIKAKLARLAQVICELEAEQEGLLALEAERSQQIFTLLGRETEWQLNYLERHNSQPVPLLPQYKELEMRLRLQRALKTAGYQTWLPTSLLLWRDQETQLPIFTLFHLYQSQSFFSIKWSKKSPIDDSAPEHEPWATLIERPISPDPLKACYRDLETVMLTSPFFPSQESWDKAGKLGITRRLGVSFSGVIPATTKQILHQTMASEVFQYSDTPVPLHHLFILRKVSEWSLTTDIKDLKGKVESPAMLLGWHPAYSDRLWHLADFDTTLSG